MKNLKSKIKFFAAGAGISAAVSGFNYLHRLACARKSPPLKAAAETEASVNSGKNKYSDIINEGKRWLEETPSKTVHISSFDGLRLTGHLYIRRGAKRTVLMMHGFRSSWKHDFSGAARDLYESGCNLLLAEQRAHGSSEGKYISYGVLERFDCLEWLRFISRRFGELPCYADGISMGATTVLMASGLQLPGNVKGIIADCGFTSPKSIISSVFSRHSSLPAWLIIPPVSLFSRFRAGFGFSDYSTLSAMRANTTPVFFAHGDADDFVPLEMTLENYRACRAMKRLLVSPGASHGTSYLVSHEAYLSGLISFFNECESR